ncbi:MAG: ThuA domain-containing protein [Armatimonadota bacterium]
MNRRKLAASALAGMVLAGAGTLLVAAERAEGAAPKKVLVVTYAAGFAHSSRPVAAATVKKLGEQSGAWEVVGVADTKEQVADALSADNLKKIDMVVFASTTGDLGLSPEAKAGFYSWIRNGGGFTGIHSASDTYHGDADYLNLVRGEFLTHGPQVKVTIHNQDPKHPATKAVPQSFEIYDEIYEFKNWERSRVHMLLTMHKHPQKDEAGDFPVAWTNRVGEGRMFYTSLGHREDVYENEIFLKHLNGGMRWALGLEKGDDKPGNPLK